ncbi:MAG: radical SAM protein [Candidatus Hydrogenedentota bacterium]|nr:MAG: radical SAM protein [Candidatus Hydrogenedentota bacterium]
MSSEAININPSVPKTSDRDFIKTQKRVLSKRGVLWLGQTCNLRCYFCYFLNRIASTEHPEHAFMTLEKAKEICYTLRNHYGDTSIDIQGGEPTIHPEILELISYCHEIGLYPTLITNGQVLADIDKLQKFKDAGVRDFLVSLHGIDDLHDEVVVRKGAYKKIIQALENMVALDVPFRLNCTMSKPVIPILFEIAQKAIDYRAEAVNFIAFNPFEDQETGIRTHDNVPTYADTKVSLNQAMDMLEDANIECNVRYLPLCMAEEKHRKNFYNFQQLPYDHHEWNYASWMWTGMQPQRMKGSELNQPYKLGKMARRLYRTDPQELLKREKESPLKKTLLYTFQSIVAGVGDMIRGKEYWYRREAKLRAIQDLQYEHHEKCQECSLREICDGFHGDYAKFYGTDEATPVTDIPLVNDPLYYIKHQDKVVEEEDKAWAL